MIRYIQTGFLGHLNDAQQFALMDQLGTGLEFPDNCNLLGDKIYPNRGNVVTQLLQSLRGHSCAREVQRKLFCKWLETYLRCKKIEGDRLKSWCVPRNPKWPPRWRPIFLKMTVYIKLATATCFYFVFGIKMIILEKNRYKL